MINEIHYHPPAIASGINLIDDTFTEFIEIYNLSESEVLLFDPQQYFENNQRYADGRTNTWRLRGDVSFEFPEDSSWRQESSLLSSASIQQTCYS